jgi:hypothetical protein
MGSMCVLFVRKKCLVAAVPAEMLGQHVCFRVVKRLHGRASPAYTIQKIPSKDTFADFKFRNGQQSTQVF